MSQKLIGERIFFNISKFCTCCHCREVCKPLERIVVDIVNIIRNCDGFKCSCIREATSRNVVNVCIATGVVAKFRHINGRDCVNTCAGILVKCRANLDDALCIACAKVIVLLPIGLCKGIFANFGDIVVRWQNDSLKVEAGAKSTRANRCKVGCTRQINCDERLGVNKCTVADFSHRMQLSVVAFAIVELCRKDKLVHGSINEFVKTERTVRLQSDAVLERIVVVVITQNIDESCFVCLDFCVQNPINIGCFVLLDFRSLVYSVSVDFVSIDAVRVKVSTRLFKDGEKIDKFDCDCILRVFLCLNLCDILVITDVIGET